MKKNFGIFNNSINQKKIQSLEEKKFKVKRLSPLLIKEVSDTKKIKIKIAKLFDFDWLVFTDIYAVDFFFEALRKVKFNLFDLDDMRICSFGELVADQLRFSQVHSDVILQDFNSDKSLKDYVGSDNELNQLSFLFLKGKGKKIYLAEKLEKICKKIEKLDVYSPSFNDPSQISKLKALILGGAIDEIILYSPEDLESLRFLIEKINIDSFFRRVRVSSQNEVILNALEELKN